MTINKIQGQTLGHAGLYLPRHVFIHDQLHIVVSSVKTRPGLKILITYDSDQANTFIVNVAYSKVFK
jgi:hypothetical protein